MTGEQVTGTGRTYQFSFGTITMAPGWPEITAAQIATIEVVWKERAALLLQQVVIETVGPQRGVIAPLSQAELDALMPAAPKHAPL